MTQQLKMMTAKKTSLNGLINFGKIPNDKLNDAFNDGRILGLIMDHLIESEFSNITHTVDANGAKSTLQVEGNVINRVECRVFSKGGANLVPAIMQGGRRYFVKSEYERWIDEIDGFIIVDKREFPTLNFVAVPTSVIQQNCTKLGKKEFDSILSGCVQL